MATSPQLTPAEFAHKWRGISTGERASARAHFMDLCRMLGEPTPHELWGLGFPGAVRPLAQTSCVH